MSPAPPNERSPHRRRDLKPGAARRDSRIIGGSGRHEPLDRLAYHRPRLFLRFERRQWHRLTPASRSVIWAVAAALTFSLMGMLIKLLGQRYSPIEVAFFRSSLGIIPLLPYLFQGGFGAFRTAHPFQHLFRGTLGVIGMFMGYWSVTKLPLALSTAVSFTAPLYMIFMAVLFLGETVRWRRGTATVAGFLGVLVIVRPFDGSISLPMAVALAGAFLSACTITLVKRMSGTERPATIVFYLSVISTIISGIPLIFVWQTPNGLDLLLFLVTGLSGGAGQVMITQAYAEGEATAVAPIDYLRLLFAIGFGFFIFAEVPTAYTLAGSAIIIGSTLYIARREQQLGKRPDDGAPIKPH
ncbi:MAG TPA: DMT family transporter [Aliidongia sp.]|nr:DMT family transporter [Aliidongia sp.]